MMRLAESLAEAVAAQIAALPAAARFLEEFPPLVGTRVTPPWRLPVCDWLSDLPTFAAPSTSRLVQGLVAAADSMAWRQTYTAADFGPVFVDRYGWSELIGLRGPIASECVACGFLLMGAGIEYPAHAHEAEELYLPLAGQALWMRGDEGFVARDPGELIEHTSWQPHAMRTAREPLLALYLWRGGDLAAKSRILAS